MTRTLPERILCPVDFSEYSSRAYAFATSLARHYRANLFVQHVVELWRHPSASFAVTAAEYEEFCRHLRDHGAEQLRRFLEERLQSDLSPDRVIEEGDATECILRLAQKQDVNLIVIGTHGARGFDRLTLGSVCEKVLRKARCSVLAVHDPAQAPVTAAVAQHTVELREILYCTDFSDYSNQACSYALSIAEEYNARITLFHVVEGIFRRCLRETTEKAYASLRRLVPESSQRDERISLMVRSGSPYREICQLAAERNADLIVMAVHGRNALDEAVFGSTTYRVVLLAGRPVLAVHP